MLLENIQKVTLIESIVGSVLHADINYHYIYPFNKYIAQY